MLRRAYVRENAARCAAARSGRIRGTACGTRKDVEAAVGPADENGAGDPGGYDSARPVPASVNPSQEPDDEMSSSTRVKPATDMKRAAASPRHRVEDPGVSAEKARSEIESGRRWVCPGPDWPPEEETCGRMLKHTGRCKECAAKRMRLRKAERREKKRQEEKMKTRSLGAAFVFPFA